ncbi:hypothetical protein NVV93_01845 [Pseudomonas sp. LS44]|uniref:hypothetical protein n=1 Tax=Pseudomonas sp. LS44 TaxID=1357074 RepID=UPI00215A597D|nr:hypothetical protein [Pseudomonas sp. LS44]UVE18169.1 hypothetical protein NVV93_01845 [Pseudomonas sp. LS44]
MKPSVATSIPPRDWCVLRLDDNGNQFVVCGDLDQHDAEALAADYQARGHKQSYWAQRSGTPIRRVGYAAARLTHPTKSVRNT